MVVTLNCLTDVYGKPNKEGIQKVIKRNIVFKKQFESNQILVEQYLNTKGEVSKKWCAITLGDTYYRIAHKFEDVKQLTEPMKIRGFRHGNT